MMKKNYQAPEFLIVSLQGEAIMAASDEAFDINVSFDELWGSNT